MRRTVIRLLGLAAAGTALILYVNWTGSRDETRFNPAAQLHCTAGTEIAAATATAPPTTHETRTPEQIATAWANSRSPDLVAGLHRLFHTDDRVDIAFDHKAQTVAVLTFRADKTLGWHLSAVVACQSTQSAAPSPS